MRLASVLSSAGFWLYHSAKCSLVQLSDWLMWQRLQALTRPVFNWAATLGESIWWLRIALSRP